MTRLAQVAKIVPCLEPQDHQAGVDGDSVNMGLYNHVAFILLFGELTGDAVLTIYEGASAGTKTTAKTFKYRATAADLKVATGDNLGAETTSAALTLTAATYEDRMLVAEIDAAELTAGLPWVTVELSSAATELFVSIVAVMVEARYLKDVPPTAIT